MPYLNTSTNTFGHSINDVRAANPESSVPDGCDCGDFLYYTPIEPVYNVHTENAVEIEPVDGIQQWRIEPATSEKIAKVVEQKIEYLWKAADSYVSGYISGVAIGILTLGVINQKPKAIAVSSWSSQIWAEYYIRKALVTGDSVDNHDFSMFGPMPYSVPELQEEVGM